jgi:hypothetical protein
MRLPSIEPSETRIEFSKIGPSVFDNIDWDKLATGKPLSRGGIEEGSISAASASWI